MKIDLHVHSKYSPDGIMTVEQILDRAKQRGLDAVAICDHDRFFCDEKPDHCVKIIRGCEFSTQYGHILGLFLQKPVEYTDFESLCREIHAQGGLAVLAHPYQRKAYINTLSKALPFIDGVEVINARATRKDRLANQKAYLFAKQNGLLIFAGSDAHTPNEIANAYTVLEDCEDIKKALRSQKVCVYGKRAKAVDTAKSVLIKIRKAKKGNIIKWFLFWCKCVLNDLANIKENGYVAYSKDW